MPRKPFAFARNKTSLALLVLALVVGGISPQASGVLKSSTGGFVFCFKPTSSLVFHPINSKCPKGYKTVVLGAQGAQGAQGVQGNLGIAGIQGSQGVQGLIGAAGQAGANGSTILHGTGTLSNEIGVDGDYFFNSALRVIYGPKTKGTWPEGVNLAGGAGAAGAAGATGATGATGPAGSAGATGATGAAGSNGTNGSNGSNGSDATLTCAQGGTCIVGNTGPGGGKVFYVQVATSTAPWRYLEAAPNTWSGDGADPTMVWCSNTTYVGLLSSGTKTNVQTSDVIGRGFLNTKMMLGSCTYGAANMAASYNGGGKSDWFLPSLDELNKLYLEKTTVGGFQSSRYWASNEGGAAYAWGQNFSTAAQDSAGKDGSSYVRPIRAF